MKKILIVCISMFCLSLLFGCSARPVKSSSELTFSRQISPEPIGAKKSSGAENKYSVNTLRALNIAAHKPSFGLVMGFYQLPQTNPAGAVVVTESDVFGRPYRAYWFKQPVEQPYSILPIDPFQVNVLNLAMNKMLDAGILFKEVSMADSLKVMKAEQEAIEKGKDQFTTQTLASGVDYLVSIQRGFSESGVIYSGRVISTRDGRLLALQTMPDMGFYSLGQLIDWVIGDSLRRLAQ